MSKKEIDLKPLNSFGIAKAVVDDNYVSIKVYGVSGCLKAWLTGKNTAELGNLVNGEITKNISTSSYDGILLTQSGRQMFYGHFPSALPTERPKIMDFNDGYQWIEVTEKKYPANDLSLRYILSHKCFYNAFLAHGKYYYGTKGTQFAVAIECDIKNEPHPFLHLSECCTYKNGYMIVCSDLKEKTYFAYE